MKQRVGQMEGASKQVGPRRGVSMPHKGLVVGIGLVLLMAGCRSIAGNACSDPSNTNAPPPDALSCDGTFLSAQNQRAILFTGDITPRLFSEKREPGAPPIDTSRINAPSGPSVTPAVAAYEGSLRIDVAVNDAAVTTDIEDLTRAGARKFNADERINIKFERATLEFVLRQLLGGALGVNYVAPDDLGGVVTFRTEQPIPKSQVLEVLRDILSRNGYAMKLINGVYHIGRPDLISGLEANGAAGRTGDRATRVLRLRRGNAAELVTLIRQLVPEEIVVQTTTAPDAIIVRATTAELQRVEELVTSLSSSRLGEDRVAVIPLRQAAPDRVAPQIEAFLRARSGLAEGVSSATIIPLERQQAILVGTRDRELLAGIRRMVETLDVDRSDDASLRILPLRFLNAEEVVPQLNVIFGGAGGGGGGVLAASARAGAGAARDGAAPSRPFPTTVSSGPTAPRAAPLSEDEEDVAVSPPLPSRVAPAPGGTAVASGGARAGLAVGGPAAAGGAGASQIRIVADPRSNAVMVYAPFSVFRRVREVLHSLDRPQAQVVIEATVLEVQINDQLQYGVQAYLQGAGINVRSAVDPTPRDSGQPGGRIAIGGNIGNVRVDVILQALQEVTNVKVISSPYLTVVDNKPARLVIGDQIPFARRSQSSNNLGNITVTEEIETKDTGVILDVTPRIFPNNSVSLAINQSVSRPSQSVLQGDRTPVIATRSVQSNVVVDSGKTVLLGGLVQERLDQNETGVPVLRTIPVVGNLFKSNEDRVSRAELVVLITPRVVRHGSQMDDVLRVIRANVNPN